MNCRDAEKKLIVYLDGKLIGTERRDIEAHLAACTGCQEKSADFQSMWSVLDELPAVTPSPAFDVLVRARVQQESNRRGLWSWLVPSPRMAFAITALLIASIWLSSLQPGRIASTHSAAGTTIQNSEADFRMIQDLPVLENYDVLTSFDALSEIPVQQGAQSQPLNQM
jgi:anti-sigma factor RsiW